MSQQKVINVDSILSPDEQHSIRVEHLSILELNLRQKMSANITYAFGGIGAITSLNMFAEGVNEGSPLKVAGGLVMGAMAILIGDRLSGFREDRIREEIAQSQAGKSILNEMVIDRYGDRFQEHHTDSNKLDAAMLIAHKEKGISTDNSHLN